MAVIDFAGGGVPPGVCTEPGGAGPVELTGRLRRYLADPCVKTILDAAPGFFLLLDQYGGTVAATRELPQHALPPIMAAQKCGRCRLPVSRCGQAVETEFAVRAAPLEVDGFRLTVFVLLELPVPGREGGRVLPAFDEARLLDGVRALLRPVANQILEAGDLLLDAGSLRVSVKGEDVPVTPLEFRLLHFMASNPGRVHSRERLLRAVWGENHFVAPRIVDVYIRQLRKKFHHRSGTQCIKTRWGSGYVFESANNGHA